jgi:prephenate dehydrogenase
MILNQITIVGVGLIGGSIGLAVKSRGVARRIVGVGRDEPTLSRAVAAGAIDSMTTDLSTGVRTADLVVVCTPVDRIVEVVRFASQEAPARSVITDVGSTKGNIVRGLAGTRPAGWAPFVGSHPLAGSEKKGAAHARADLFLDRLVVVTPLTEADQEAASVVDLFWEALGARVVRMRADEHDEAVATTSHLPHAIASGLAGITPGEWLSLTAGGYRDGTRVAVADPDLWAAIFLANQDAMLRAIDRFGERLAEFRQLLAVGDRQSVERWLSEGKRVRDALGS